jgi:hypothetical protein
MGTLKRKIIEIMESNKPQKRIQVYPNTWILIDADRNEQEAKYLWLRKHALQNHNVDEQQKRRELMTIRSGKVMQRTRYKK